MQFSYIAFNMNKLLLAEFNSLVQSLDCLCQKITHSLIELQRE
jgi:hypothetical protein